VIAEWINESVKAEKELIPEIDESVGAEEIEIQPGTEVWHKVYNRAMLVSYIFRDIYEKELKYGLTYMVDDREVSVNSHRYALIPMLSRIEIYKDDSGNNDRKYGSLFTDFCFRVDSDISISDFSRFGGEF